MFTRFLTTSGCLLGPSAHLCASGRVSIAASTEDQEVRNAGLLDTSAVWFEGPAWPEAEPATLFGAPVHE